MDATGKAISHVVPSGGLVGLGALASDLDASNAAINKSILDTLGTNINSANLQTLINLAHAIVTAGIPNASSLIPLIVASLIQERRRSRRLHDREGGIVAPGVGGQAAGMAPLYLVGSTS